VPILFMDLQFHFFQKGDKNMLVMTKVHENPFCIIISLPFIISSNNRSLPNYFLTSVLLISSLCVCLLLYFSYFLLLLRTFRHILEAWFRSDVSHVLPKISFASSTKFVVFVKILSPYSFRTYNDKCCLEK
jgi:hypothetical protein